MLLNRLGGLNLPMKSVVRLTDCPDMTLAAYPGRKTTKQQPQTILSVVLSGIAHGGHTRGQSHVLVRMVIIK